MSNRSGEASPLRGEIWEVGLDPTVGREQAARRPALVVSDNALNSGPRGLVLVIPVTKTNRGLPSHIPVDPPQGGLTRPSVIMVEQLWAVSKERLERRLGVVTPATMDQVGQILRIVLAL